MNDLNKFNVGSDDGSWRTPLFRQSVVAKIDDSIQRSGMSTSRNSIEMENHVFQKAKSKEEYLSMVARLILHVREINAKKSGMAPGPGAQGGAGASQGPGQAGGPGGQGPGGAGSQGMNPDPINALQNLASQGSRNNQMMGPQGQQMQGAQGNMGPNNPMGAMQGQMGPQGNMGQGPQQNSPATNLLQTLNQRPQLNMQQLQNKLGPNIGMVPNQGPMVGNQMGQNQMGGQMVNQMNNPMGGAMPGQMGPGGMGGQMVQGQMNPNMQGGMVGGNPMSGQMGNQMTMMQQHMQQQQQRKDGAGVFMNQCGPGMGQGGPGMVQGGPGMGQGGPMGQTGAGMGPGSSGMGPSGSGMGPGGPGMGPGGPMVQGGPMGQGMPMGQGGPGMGPGMGPGGPGMGPGTSGLGQSGPGMNQAGPGGLGQGGPRAGAPSHFLRQSPSPSAQPSPAPMGGPSPMGMMGGPMASPMSVGGGGNVGGLGGGGGGVASPALAPSPSHPSQHQQQHMQQQQRGMGMAPSPSPSSSLNTPLGGAAPSPGGAGGAEEHAYGERVRRLSKYIEPLRRMIARMVSDGENVERLTKMRNFLDVISHPSKRMPLETLLKCEVVLEKLDFKRGEGMLLHPHSNPLHLQGIKEHQIYNPLLEVVSNVIMSSVANHTLKGTFGPSVEALSGPEIRHMPPPLKKQKVDEPQSDVPDILQGEIARLDSRFKVSLEGLQVGTGGGIIRLVARLEDARLPCVPAVCVSVPRSYPQCAPLLLPPEAPYSAAPFLRRVRQALTARLAALPRKYSLSQLLDTWEMSVRHACNPNATETMHTPTTLFLGI